MKNCWREIINILLILTVMCSPAYAIVLTTDSGDVTWDNYLRSNTPDTNYGSDATLNNRKGLFIGRNVMRIDATLPEGVQIDSATAHIYCFGSTNQDRDVCWWRYTSSYYNTVLLNVVESEATWNKPCAACSTWNGAYASVADASCFTPLNDGANHWYEVDLTTALQTVKRDGLLDKSSWHMAYETTSGNSSYLTCTSSEGGANAYYLVITYSSPTPSCPDNNGTPLDCGNTGTGDGGGGTACDGCD